MAIFTDKIFPSSGETGAGGGIIQVVNATSTTNNVYNGGTGSWYDMQPQPSITLHQSSNKVLIFVTCGLQMEWCGQTGFKLLRGSTEVTQAQGYCWNNTRWQYAPAPFSGVVDSPGSTGPHTYKVQTRTSRNATLNWNSGHGSTTNGTAQITLMEFSS